MYVADSGQELLAGEEEERVIARVKHLRQTRLLHPLLQYAELSGWFQVARLVPSFLDVIPYPGHPS